MRLAPEHVPRVVAQEFRRSGVAVPLDDPAGGRQKEGETGIRGRAIEDARSVPDGYAEGRSVGNIDVIDSDTVVADDTHAGDAVKHGAVEERMPIGIDAGDQLDGAFLREFPGKELHPAVRKPEHRGVQWTVGDNAKWRHLEALL